MSKKYFKALKTRAQYSVNKVSKRKKGTWKSKFKNIKFTDWEQDIDSMPFASEQAREDYKNTFNNK